MTTPDEATAMAAVDALTKITGANVAVRAAQQRRDIDKLLAAQDDLRAAVHLAVYDLQVSWQSIGDALNLRRGNAYQQFRRRRGPQSPKTLGDAA